MRVYVCTVYVSTVYVGLCWCPWYFLVNVGEKMEKKKKSRLEGDGSSKGSVFARHPGTVTV